MQHHPKQLLYHVKDQKEDFVQLLQELVEIETPPGHGDQQKKLLDVLDFYLDELGYDIDRLSGTRSGGQLYARPRNRRHNAPFQLLLGYADTEWPADTLKKMPFKWDRQRVKGPGVLHMKAGLAMLIIALRTQHEFDIIPSLTPVIYIYSDEILGTPESRPTIERLSRYADRAFTLEPSLERDGKIITSCKGRGTYKVKLRKKSAPTGLKPNANNGSMLELSHVVQRMYDLNDPKRDIQVEVSEFDGGIRSNVITGNHHATVNISLAHKEDIKTIENTIHEIESTTSTVDLSIKGDIQRPPMPFNERNHALWEKVSRIAETLDIEISNGISQSATVGTLTSQNTATIGGLGPVGSGRRSSHESIDLDKTMERCALLSLLLAKS